GPVNDDARFESDTRSPRAARLRYVDAEKAAGAAVFDAWGSDGGGPEPLPIRNEEGEDLGEFDGLVIDPSSNRPRYLVVRGAGLLARRRYLVPAGVVRFDGSARVLRVALTKEIAERYPPFEPDRFDAMSDHDLEAFDARLAGNFPMHVVRSAAAR